MIDNNENQNEVSDQEVVKKAAAGQQMFIACSPYIPCTGGEISLVDIWRFLGENKKIISGSFFAGIFSAVLVAFSLPNVYRAESVVFPPGTGDVAGLYLGELYKTTPLQVYEEYIKNLQSNKLRYQFFEGHQFSALIGKNIDNNVDKYEIFEKHFNRRLRVVSQGKNKGKRNDFQVISLEGINAELLPDWLDEFITFVDKCTVDDIVSGIQAQLKVRAEAVKEQIVTLRLIASRKHKDRVARLEEALAIAKMLGIEKPTNLDYNNQKRNEKKGGATIVLEGSSAPLYFRGYGALLGELEQLQKRKNNDSFILGLRELQGKAAFLEKKRINLNKIHAVRVDQKAIVLSKPVRPKRSLIIILGSVVGCVVGVFLSLIRKIDFG